MGITSQIELLKSVFDDRKPKSVVWDNASTVGVHLRIPDHDLHDVAYDYFKDNGWVMGDVVHVFHSTFFIQSYNVLFYPDCQVWGVSDICHGSSPGVSELFIPNELTLAASLARLEALRWRYKSALLVEDVSGSS